MWSNTVFHKGLQIRNDLCLDFMQQTLCDDLEQTQPQLGELLTNGRLLLDKVPGEDRAFLESQLNALEELQANVIRKSLAKQEELIRYIVQQQDFQTQVQSCMHVLQEVETSLGEWELGVASGLIEMKEKLSLCEVRVVRVLLYRDEKFSHGVTFVHLQSYL